MRKSKLSVLFIYLMLTIGLFILSVTVMSIPMVWVLSPLWIPAALGQLLCWIGVIGFGADNFVTEYNKILLKNIEAEKERQNA